MRFGLTRSEHISRTSARIRGLGQITDAELQAANAKLDELNARITRQYAIVYEARRVGFGRDIVDEAMRQYDRILEHISALALTPPGNSAELAEWLARAEGVEGEVDTLERQVAESFPSAGRARLVQITLTTGLVLAGAGVLAAGVWYYSRSRRWYRYVYGRRGRR